MWDGGGFKMIFPEYQHGGDIYGIQGVDLDFSVNLHPVSYTHLDVYKRQI